MFSTKPLTQKTKTSTIIEIIQNKKLHPMTKSVHYSCTEHAFLQKILRDPNPAPESKCPDPPETLHAIMDKTNLEPNPHFKSLS